MPMARCTPSAVSSPAIWISRGGSSAGERGAARSRAHAHRSLRHGHELEHMSVGVLKIDAAAAVPIVELAVFEAPGRAAEGDFRLLDAVEDSVELAVADMESVVVALELRSRRRTGASAIC